MTNMDRSLPETRGGVKSGQRLYGQNDLPSRSASFQQPVRLRGPGECEGPMQVQGQRAGLQPLEHSTRTPEELFARQQVMRETGARQEERSFPVEDRGIE